MNTETLAAIKEVQDLKKNPNKKKYSSFSELLKEEAETIISALAQNIRDIFSYSDYSFNWDGEEGLPFGKDFLCEVIVLLTGLPVQPDVGATGRGSIVLEYGSCRDHYLMFEIFEADRAVRVYEKNEDGSSCSFSVKMDDVRGCVQERFCPAKPETEDNMKTMTDQEALDLISRAHRAECDEDPRVFLKGVRATLIALGYDEEWANGRFREIIEDFVK